MRFHPVVTRAIASGIVGVAAGAGLLAGNAEAGTRDFSCGRFGSYSNGPGRVVDFTTTGGCLDININLTSAQAQTFGRSCLNPGAGERCSEWKLLPFGWTTLSTNVRGGTRFSVDLSGNNGQEISYELAY
jgi:hypothetical protein